MKINSAYLLMRTMNVGDNMGLKDLFEQMHQHTLPECAKCITPYSCCQKQYCDLALKYTKDVYKIDLTDQIVNDKVPFLSPTGCVLPPHYKPICSIHTCEISSFGQKRGDPEWTEKYYELRTRIMKSFNLDIEQHLKWLESAKEAGDINETIYEIAAAFHDVPAAYVENGNLRYTWQIGNRFIHLLIAPDGKLQMLVAVHKKD